MIALLTIVIAIFLLINMVALSFVSADLEPKIIYNISKIILISEIVLIVLGFMLLISYGISHAIVCSATNNDYQGCIAEGTESGNNE